MKIKQVLIKEEKDKIVKQATQLNARYKAAQGEQRLTHGLLKEFKFMKNIDTLDKFKDLITSCEFWADTWAISTIERIFNIKLIILSSEMYRNKETDNVLQCGEINDKLLKEKGEFNPEYYIILDYTGDHYKLITYKKRGALRFKELPYDIKNLIVNKCMERQSGAFSIIPEFRDFTKGNSYNIEQDAESEIESLKINKLYDDKIVFQFYNKSNGKPLPGKGSGEMIPPENIIEFSKLSKIDNWRQKLDNFWNKNPIKLDGLSWQSVEHYYQANKFKKNNIDFYKLFSIESNSGLSTDPEYAKAAGSKTGKLGKEKLRDKSITIDVDFVENSDRIMEKAMYSKFTQHSDLQDLLIETKNAKLVHYVKANPVEVYDNLMRVRKIIIDQNN